jgi:hypothetical protein
MKRSDRWRLPVLVRLTRRGSTITTEYSLDEGRSFRPASAPVTFHPPLPRTVYAGASIWAPSESEPGEVTLHELRIAPTAARR